MFRVVVLSALLTASSVWAADPIVTESTTDSTVTRKMAWFSLVGLLVYPIGIAVTSAFGMDKASTLIADIAPTYFASIAVLVSAFFGADAMKGKK